MSITAKIRRFASDWHAAWREARTERLLSALPSDIRKDIGWPSQLRHHHRPFSVS